MRKYIYISIAIVILTLSLVVTIQAKRNKSIKADRDVYKNNTEVLAKSVKQYQTKEALNVATIGILEFEKSEFEKYRAETAQQISELKIEKRELQSVTTMQTETINKLKGSFRDSVIYLAGDTVTTVLNCIDISNKWFEFHGCVNRIGDFEGTYINRESLLIAATTEYKRFWGFLWKTNKIKDRKIDVVSRNPATVIERVEHIEIRK